jgi:pilus assembly protein Flp/PilA
MKSLVSRFVKNESGATAIEYGLIAAGISVAIIAVVQGLGTKLTSTFTSVKNALNYVAFDRFCGRLRRSPEPFRLMSRSVPPSYVPYFFAKITRKFGAPFWA